MVDSFVIFRKPYVLVALLVLLSLVSYAQTFRYDFCYDDQKLIVARAADYENPRIVPIIFKAPFWGFSPSRVSNYYRPLVTLTYWLNYRWFDLKPGFYHASNVLIHAMNGILLFLALALVSRQKAFSFWSSAVFVVHPIHTANVAWVSGRTDPLALLFLLISFLLFALMRLYEGLWRPFAAMLSAVSFLAALLCKEVALLFPLVFAGCDLFLFRPWGAKKKIGVTILPYIGLGAAALVYFKLRASALESSFPPGLLHEAFSVQAFFHIPSIVAYYVKALFLPGAYYLHPAWSIPGSLKQVSAWVNFAVFFGLAAVFVLCRRAVVRVAILVFYASLAPVLYTFLKDNPVNEHWAYIPCLGFAILSGAFLTYLDRWRTGNLGVGTAIGIFLLGVSVLFCWFRNIHYENNFALYTDGIRKRPDLTIYCINLGEVYEKMGDPEKAKKLWEHALQIDPKVESAYRNIGVLYAKKGDYAKALEYFEKELVLYPDKIPTLMDSGRACLMMGEQEKGLRYYEKAFSLDPKYSPIEANKIAVDFYVNDRPREAMELWKAVIRHAPSFAEAYISLGSALAKAGRYDEALAACRSFVADFPNHPRSREVEAWIEDVKRKKAPPQAP